MRSFDAYLIVDWSANSTPKAGKDSIWYCLVESLTNTPTITALENPPTRHAAIDQLLARLQSLARANYSVLVGFDFAYGYPAGLASALH